MGDLHLASRAAALFEGRYGPLCRGGSLVGLQDLVRGFAHLPYENLSKILASNAGRSAPRRRSPATVMEDHLELGTGGTCFSLTELLRVIGRAAEFECYPVMAHMRHGPNIHCALRVEADRRAYLVDPGYLVRRPLPLQTSPAHAASPAQGEVLLVPAGTLGSVPSGVPDGDFDLFTVEAEGPRWRYRFSDRAPTEDEFISHWNASFYQPGMRSLLVTQRSEAGELLYLHNHKLRSQGSGHTSTQNIRLELEESVERIFGISPSVTRRAAAVLHELRAARRK
jgi:arylamine N-acetyltransferase